MTSVIRGSDDFDSGQAHPVLMTAQASTSGTAIDFTGIPSWAKRVTVMFNGVSTNGTSNLLVRLGTSSGVESTGYDSVVGVVNASPSAGTSSSGLVVTLVVAAASLYNGSASITNISSNTWVSSSLVGAGATQVGSGTKTLSGTLTQLRITTVNGTDVFDAGSINVMYE